MPLPRESASFTARFESWALPRLARALPRWVVPDHLTGFALAAALSGGGAYVLAGQTLAWLHVASLALVLHWLGDSLDGTLARVRDIRRERYGFFVDHSADAVAAWLLLGGLALSGLVRPWLPLAVAAGYLTHMLHAAQVGIARGRYVLAPAGGVGPTEVRLVLIGMNTAVWALGNPTVRSPGWTLLDAILLTGLVLLLATWAGLLLQERARLSREDPPPGPRRPAERSPHEAPAHTTASRPVRDPA